MDINELTYKSLKNYYSVLRKTGNLKCSEVYKLLTLTFINDLFDDEYSWYILEDDYHFLIDLVHRLSKSSCIIPNVDNIRNIEPIKNYREDMPTRVSEDNIIKLTQNDRIRVLS